MVYSRNMYNWQQTSQLLEHASIELSMHVDQACKPILSPERKVTRHAWTEEGRKGFTSIPERHSIYMFDYTLSYFEEAVQHSQKLNGPRCNE